VLREGALPAQLTEATKTIVGPSLGADSIQKGIYATIFGAALVFLFMLVYYRGSGLIANVTLAVNLLFILAVMALLQATLTLPGIAGMILTLGMAVDANVLIFERIREELRSGKDARAAIKAGYSNAIRTITDANITGLIAGVVLYQFGTGPIKGFAVTLMIGLIISMYTAIICTRMVYDYFLIKRKITKVSI
jgi:preprotein translocase subunit SecD